MAFCLLGCCRESREAAGSSPVAGLKAVPVSESKTPLGGLESRIKDADLIVVGRITRIRGSHVKNCNVAVSQIIAGRLSTEREMVVLFKPTARFEASNPDAEWILFLQVPEPGETGPAFRSVVGDGRDVSGMEIATGEAIRQVETLCLRLGRKASR
jgi:hypothetical protein